MNVRNIVGIGTAAAIGVGSGVATMVAMRSDAARDQPFLVGLPVTIGGMALATRGGAAAGSAIGASLRSSALAGMGGLAAGVTGAFIGGLLVDRHIPATGTAGLDDDPVGDVRGGELRDSFFVPPGAELGHLETTTGDVTVRAAGGEYSVGYDDPRTATSHFINEPHRDVLPPQWAVVGVTGAPADRRFRAVGVEYVRADGTVVEDPEQLTPKDPFLVDHPGDGIQLDEVWNGGSGRISEHYAEQLRAGEDGSRMLPDA
jgi:hypothetical protein